MDKLILDWAVLTISFFNTVSLLWLGLMVLLAGNRRAMGTWVTGGGLLAGALFFTSHTAILGRGLAHTSLGMDFWWWVSWLPAAAAPMAWYGALLWYSGYRIDRPHRHHLWLIVVLTLAASIGMLLIFANPLPNYTYVAGRVLRATPSIGGVPLLILAYLLYSLLCYLLPLDVLRNITGATPLDARTRLRARPWLVAASIALLLAGVLLAYAALWAVTTSPVPSLSDPLTERFVLRLDLAVEALVAVAITLLGRAIVGFEVFTGRPLPRNRFFRYWRSTILLAGGFGAVVAASIVINLRPLYSLMLATLLMTLFYALYSWRTFAEREAFMARLRPFVASQNLYGQMTSVRGSAAGTTPGGDKLQENENVASGDQGALGVQGLFDTLCRDVMEVESGVLVPAGALAALAGPPLVYPPGAAVPAAVPATWAGRFSPGTASLPAGETGDPPGADWAIALWSSRGLDGVLFLGEKTNHNPFTEEEIEIAQAGGERLLDLMAGAEMARLAMDLLRQRLAQARVMEGQGRRVLHDEVLPQLHTALLFLSGAEPSAEVQQAKEILAAAHHRIAGLMRDLPLAVPHRLAHEGLAAALRSMIERDFASDFTAVHWEIDAQAAAHARNLPLFVNEVLFFAARELVRNAATHAAQDGEQEVCLTIRMAINDPLEMSGSLRLEIIDNGSGFRPEPLAATGGSHSGRPAEGSHSGLRIHSAMLAAVGARLEVQPAPAGGTQGVITI